VFPSFEQRLENIALVHFRIADESDHPPLDRLFLPILRPHIILHQRCKQRLRDPEPDRTGQKINQIAVFRPRGIGLRAAKSAVIRA
jgi:hypothetical protein